MFFSDKKYYTDQRLLLFHKNPLVELTASLHLLNVDEPNPNRWLTSSRKKSLNGKIEQSLALYGQHYANWLLIMDIATYISCVHYETAGKTEITFEEAISEYARLDDVTFLYLFFGMSALGFSREDAADILEHPQKIDDRVLHKIGQYVLRDDIYLFVRNLKELRKDLQELLVQYWIVFFEDVWNDLESTIDQTIKRESFHLDSAGDLQFLANLHKGIEVTKGKVILKKEIPYVIDLSEIEKIHVFPSAFAGEEVMMDKQDENLIIYYSLNLKEAVEKIRVPQELCLKYKALSDENRLKIMKIIWDSPATTQYLANALDLAQSTVSVHLKNLKAAELVKSKTIKKYVYYEANREALSNLDNQLEKFLSSQ